MKGQLKLRLNTQIQDWSPEYLFTRRGNARGRRRGEMLGNFPGQWWSGRTIRKLLPGRSSPRGALVGALVGGHAPRPAFPRLRLWVLKWVGVTVQWCMTISSFPWGPTARAGSEPPRPPAHARGGAYTWWPARGRVPGFGSSSLQLSFGFLQYHVQPRRVHVC